MNILLSNLRAFDTVNFRTYYKRFIYIHCRELLEEMFPGELNDGITGIIAYSYIDTTEGISFRPVTLARITGDTLRLFDLPHQEDTIFVIRLREGETQRSELHNNNRHMYLFTIDYHKHSFFDTAIVGMDEKIFEQIKQIIDTKYAASEMVEETRGSNYSFLDKFRHPFFPDDVKALLFSPEKGIEQIWARITFITIEDDIFAELLNEPNSDYGCDKGSLIEIKLIEDDKNSYMVFTGRIAKQA